MVSDLFLELLYESDLSESSVFASIAVFIFLVFIFLPLSELLDTLIGKDSILLIFKIYALKILIRKEIIMSYNFRSFRKPHISKINEVLEGTKELRKIMGWSGQGGITTPLSNPVSLISHFKAFESMEEIDEHLDKMSSKKEVGIKIKELNSYCDIYLNAIFEILRSASGPYIDDMKNNKYVIQYWMKAKIGRGSRSNK